MRCGAVVDRRCSYRGYVRFRLCTTAAVHSRAARETRRIAKTLVLWIRRIDPGGLDR